MSRLSGPVTLAPVGTTCACVTTHRPDSVVLEHHHVWPQEFGGPTVAENLVWICATAHNSVHAYLRRFIHAGQMLSPAPLRVALAAAGYPTYVNPYTWQLAVTGYDRLTRRAM